MLYLCGIVLQCTWVLCCGVQYCMLHCTTHSHCNPYNSIGTQDILSCLLLHGQAVGVCSLHQQGDGRTHLDHHEAFSGLAPGLVTPHDLPESNTDGDVWLMSLLLLGFGQISPWLGHLKPVHRHTYLLDDEGIRHPN